MRMTGNGTVVQRYYASSYGRFNTADPSSHSAHPKNPGSWNRYAYTLGDPVNGNDPRGLEQQVCTDPTDPDCPLLNTEPDPCWDLSLGLFDGSLNCGAPVSAPAAGDDDSTDDDSTPLCDIKVQHTTLGATLGLGVHSCRAPDKLSHS
jgi:RHS repeat-associated protein